MSKQQISKLIVQLYEKNYADANTSLKNILEGKIAAKAMRIAKAKEKKEDKKDKTKKDIKKIVKKGPKKNK